MASKGLVVTVQVDGARETLAAFRALPKDANNELRDASLKLATVLAGRAQTSARAEGRQGRILAPTVKARRDRLPVIEAGGTKRIGRNRKPAWKLLFGSEFGSNRLRQFKPHLGSGSYWFFRTIEDNQAYTDQEWRRAADAVIRAFSAGGA